MSKQLSDKEKIELQREITHRNVLRLQDAVKEERRLREDLHKRMDLIEKSNQMLQIQLLEVSQKANTAFALVQQGRV